jgi:hypothetical protein
MRDACTPRSAHCAHGCIANIQARSAIFNIPNAFRDIQYTTRLFAIFDLKRAPSRHLIFSTMFATFNHQRVFCDIHHSLHIFAILLIFMRLSATFILSLALLGAINVQHAFSRYLIFSASARDIWHQARPFAIFNLQHACSRYCMNNYCKKSGIPAATPWISIATRIITIVRRDVPITQPTGVASVTAQIY